MLFVILPPRVLRAVTFVCRSDSGFGSGAFARRSNSDSDSGFGSGAFACRSDPDSDSNSGFGSVARVCAQRFIRRNIRAISGIGCASVCRII